jgi:hypothetical protein
MNNRDKSMSDKLELEKRNIINDIKNKLKFGKEIINCDSDELNYIGKPIGKSIYKSALDNKKPVKKKYNGSDRVICDLCGNEYRKSNKSIHVKTRIHQTYKQINDKLKNLILN